MIVLPAIDLQGGKCVRLLRGDFDAVTEYSDNPAEVARQYAAFAATHLHIVDLDGARHGTQQNRDIVAAIAAETQLRIQLGGGIRDAETLEGWLDAGVTRCVVGSLAITNPATVKAWLNRFGSDSVVLAMDVKLDAQDEAIITTHGWTRNSTTTLFDCIEDFRQAGLKHVLCTDVSRDGAMTGPNFALYQRILDRFPGLELQASGGIRSIADLQELRRAGVPAAISGRALLDGSITAGEIESFLRNA